MNNFDKCLEKCHINFDKNIDDLIDIYIKTQNLRNKNKIITNLISTVNKRIIVLSTYFNLTKNKYIKNNLINFYNNLKKQGVLLYVAELSLDTEFELDESCCDKLYQIKKKNYMWYKESLLNFLLDKIPKSCEIVCWIDADIIFENDFWAIELYYKRKKFNVLQLFQNVIRCNNKPLEYYKKNPNIKKYKGYVYKYLNKINTTDIIPGYAWAIKTDIIKEMKFYDKCILGGGDTILINSFMKTNIKNFYFENESYIKDIKKYKDKMYKLVNKKISNLNGCIYHLYHGNYNNRNYGNRYLIYKMIKFDPNLHLKRHNDYFYNWNYSDDFIIKINKMIHQYMKIKSDNKINDKLKQKLIEAVLDKS